MLQRRKNEEELLFSTNNSKTIRNLNKTFSIFSQNNKTLNTAKKSFKNSKI